tara:strand:- start:2408 stop:2524 length:117 start_codon:yes stop_codon:yes gene_type:complete
MFKALTSHTTGAGSHLILHKGTSNQESERFLKEKRTKP